MKIIYIGKCNSLASKLVDRLVKEEDQVYIISEHAFLKGTEPSLPFKSYKYNAKDIGISKIFSSVRPDVVIFAGDIYLKEIWEYDNKTNSYLSELLNVLNQSLLHNVQKFIFLSTNEVYTNSNQLHKESDEKKPSTYKGELCNRGEELVLDFHNLHSMNVAILRMVSIYGCSLKEREQDFISNIAMSFHTLGSYNSNSNRYISALHINDCVDAIFRVKSLSQSFVYNVGYKEMVREDQVADLINQQFNEMYQVLKYDGDLVSNPIDNQRIKSELEWVGYYQLKDIISEIDLSLTDEMKAKSKKKLPRSNFLTSVENSLVFFVFSVFILYFQNHAVISSIDFMVIYITMMALLLGIRQSVLSVILASLFALMKNGLQIWDIISILTNMEFILTATQYIFIGVIVGYAVDYYRGQIKEKENEYVYLNKEYQEIKEINDDNIMIKQEYEKRILNYKNSLPKLYTIINKLTVLEPEKIFVEAIDVIKDIMDTETVSIYLSNEKSKYIRLIASSNVEAIFRGKSIDLDKYPKIKEKILQNELFIGSQWDESEPSLAAPIFHDEICIGVIIIKEMKFSRLTLYQLNLFRTLTVLITSSLIKAKGYEAAVRTKQYIDDTDILNEIEFKKLIEIKNEGKKKGIFDYCIIKLLINGDIKETYYKIVNSSRNTDFFGINDKQELFMLLNNTNAHEVGYVLERLKSDNINAEIVSD